MKHIYLLFLSSFVFLSAFAGDTNSAYQSGDWSNKNIWSEGHVPKDGETVIINPGVTVTVDKPINGLTSNIQVYGQLILDKHVKLGENNAVELKTTSASLTSTTKQAGQFLQIGDAVKFAGNQNPYIQKGVATANKNTSTAPKGFATVTTLPVKFLSFNVAIATNGVSVQWATAEEVNADVFEIERSEDGKTWRTAGTVKAVGNSTNVQNYSFIDRAILNKIAYYRIRQVDLDGKYTYTSVKTVVNQSNVTSTINNVNIVAAGSKVVVNFSQQVKGAVVVRLISFGGQVLAQQTYSQPSQQIVFSKTNVTKGAYIISVSNNSDLNASRQVAL